MRVVADLHLHSKYAMAASKDTDLEPVAAGTKSRGLTLLGTGDFTHPLWFKEPKSKLEPIVSSGLFSYAGVTRKAIAGAILAQQEDRVKVVPGYDGVYGEPGFA